MPTHARHASVHGAHLCCMLTHAAAQAKLVEAAPPSQRYLDLIVSGAAAIGLDETYLAWLRGHEVLPSTTYLPNETTELATEPTTEPVLPLLVVAYNANATRMPSSRCLRPN